MLTGYVKLISLHIFCHRNFCWKYQHEFLC